MSPLFRLLSSPVTAIVLGSLLLAVLTAGLAIPQVSDADVARAIPSAVAQVAIPLGLSDLTESWLVETLAVMMALNLVGYALSRSVATGATGDADVAFDTTAVALTPVSLPGRATRLITGVAGDVTGVMRAALPKLFLGKLRGGVHGHYGTQLHGTSGLRVEAFLLAVIGVGLIAFAPRLGGTALDARLSILEGDDAVAESRSRGERRQGDLWIPWKPSFKLSCTAAPDLAELAPRACTVVIDGKPHQAALETGRDLEFDGLRVTWTGVSRTATVGGVDLTLTLPFATTRGAAGPGDIVDLFPASAPKGPTVPEPMVPLASALVGTTSAGDPLGIITGSDPSTARTGPFTASVLPRRQLHFAVKTTGHAPWVTGGLALLAIALILALVLPTYRLAAIKRGDQLVLTVDGTGLAARPQRYLDRIVSRLAASPPPPRDGIPGESTP